MLRCTHTCSCACVHTVCGGYKPIRTSTERDWLGLWMGELQLIGWEGSTLTRARGPQRASSFQLQLDVHRWDGDHQKCSTTKTRSHTQSCRPLTEYPTVTKDCKIQTVFASQGLWSSSVVWSGCWVLGRDLNGHRKKQAVVLASLWR